MARGSHCDAQCTGSGRGNGLRTRREQYRDRDSWLRNRLYRASSCRHLYGQRKLICWVVTKFCVQAWSTPVRNEALGCFEQIDHFYELRSLTSRRVPNNPSRFKARHFAHFVDATVLMPGCLARLNKNSDYGHAIAYTSPYARLQRTGCENSHNRVLSGSSTHTLWKRCEDDTVSYPYVSS